METDGFVTVVRKQRRERPEKKIAAVAKEDIIAQYKKILIRHGAVAAILYGSRARGTNRITSDIDVMVFWQKSNFPENTVLKNIYSELRSLFDLEMDFVVMKFSPHRKRDVSHSPSDKNFMNNVVAEGIIMFGDSSCAHYVSSSEKVVKIHM